MAIDALRGLAIAGIFLYHSVSRFNFPSTYATSASILLSLDVFIEKAAYFLLFGKMFGIFSFLFGYTYQLQNGVPRGPGKARIIWRMILLLLFGLFNSLFIPMGDILVFYAIIGILITPLFFFNTSMLFLLAVILLLQPFELYRTFVSFANPSLSFSSAYHSGLQNEINQTLVNGNAWEIIKANLVKGVPASLLWNFQSGRITQIPGLFILGIVAARKGIYHARLFGRKYWLKMSLIFGSAIAIVWLVKISAVSNRGSSVCNDSLNATLSLWINTLSTMLIVSVFTLLYYINRGRLFHPLSYLGKASLTNYIGQSVMGALFFAPFGLNLANTTGIAFSVLLTIILLLCQILFSRAWLGKHKKGPIETLWYYLTWIGKKTTKDS